MTVTAIHIAPPLDITDGFVEAVARNIRADPKPDPYKESFPEDNEESFACLRERLILFYANSNFERVTIHLNTENCEALAGRVQTAIREQFPQQFPNAKAKAEITENTTTIVISSGSEVSPRDFFVAISGIVKSILNNGGNLPDPQEENLPPLF